MTIEWETYQLTLTGRENGRMYTFYDAGFGETCQLTLTGRENGELAVRIQSFPPGEKFKFTGNAEVWIDESPTRVCGAQFYADGNSVEELKQDLLKWREAFKAMMETP